VVRVRTSWLIRLQFLPYIVSPLTKLPCSCSVQRPDFLRMGTALAALLFFGLCESVLRFARTCWCFWT